MEVDMTWGPAANGSQIEQRSQRRQSFSCGAPQIVLRASGVKRRARIGKIN